MPPRLVATCSLGSSRSEPPFQRPALLEHLHPQLEARLTQKDLPEPAAGIATRPVPSREICTHLANKQVPICSGNDPRRRLNRGPSLATNSARRRAPFRYQLCAPFEPS